MFLTVTAGCFHVLFDISSAEIIQPLNTYYVNLVFHIIEAR